MATFFLKARDTLPVLEVALRDPAGTAHDLTGATGCTLHVKLSSGVTFSRSMSIAADPTTGIVTYIWDAADWTSTPALAIGTYQMEYEVVGPLGARLTFPNNGFDKLAIGEDIGQAS